jgi:hypothetical protein
VVVTVVVEGCGIRVVVSTTVVGIEVAIDRIKVAIELSVVVMVDGAIVTCSVTVVTSVTVETLSDVTVIVTVEDKTEACSVVVEIIVAVEASSDVVTVIVVSCGHGERSGDKNGKAVTVSTTVTGIFLVTRTFKLPSSGTGAPQTMLGLKLISGAGAFSVIGVDCI